MSVNILEKNKCTGCYACSNVCPKKCIKMERDSEGFVYPSIDEDLCVNCDLCNKVCPVLNKAEVKECTSEPKIYAAWSENMKIRYNSTSGGVFSELAIKFLERGGYLCGAKYGKDHHIEHCIVNTREGLDEIRQSKYAQSDMGNVYTDIKNLLDEGKKVMFCGTPCACAGLINYVGEKRENLFIVDFICRGSNSPKVYEKFLAYLEKKYKSKIKKVWFKNKTYGWNKFSTKIEFENGQFYLEDRYHDLFIVGYIRYNLYMRPSCAECDYRGLPRVSDITLADFWGVKMSDISKDVEQGTSLVMINTSKGAELFESIKENLYIEEKELEDTIKGNPSLFSSPVMNKKREYFFKNLDRVPLDRLARRCFRDEFSLKKTVRKAVSQIVPNEIKKSLKAYRKG